MFVSRYVHFREEIFPFKMTEVKTKNPAQYHKPIQLVNPTYDQKIVNLDSVSMPLNPLTSQNSAPQNSSHLQSLVPEASMPSLNSRPNDSSSIDEHISQPSIPDQPCLRR